MTMKANESNDEEILEKRDSAIRLDVNGTSMNQIDIELTGCRTQPDQSDSSDTSEIGSSSTVLAQNGANVAASCVQQTGNSNCDSQQILSAQNLVESLATGRPRSSAPSKSQENVQFIEVDLDSDIQEGEEERNPIKPEVEGHQQDCCSQSAGEVNMYSSSVNQSARIRMNEIEQEYADYSKPRFEIDKQNVRGFIDAEPKVSFSSHRMKEYFESFKSHSGDTKHLYQFFKSIRTELVACLLFALISSYGTILSRTYFQLDSIHLWFHYHNRSNTHSIDSARWPTESNQSNGFDTSGRLSAQLASGLLVSLTVASLTQIFGHISGCHLVPSISLALYIKGHIGRARFFGYLLAQALGSLLGIGLLALLTSSQLVANPTAIAVSQPAERKQELFGSSLPDSHSTIALEHLLPRGRRSVPSEGADADFDINLDDIQGSETILLSIIGQQQLRQEQQQQQATEKNNSIRKSPEAQRGPTEAEAEKTITLSPGIASTYPPTSANYPLPSSDTSVELLKTRAEVGSSWNENNNNTIGPNIEHSRVVQEIGGHDSMSTRGQQEASMSSGIKERDSSVVEKKVSIPSDSNNNNNNNHNNSRTTKLNRRKRNKMKSPVAGSTRLVDQNNETSGLSLPNGAASIEEHSFLLDNNKDGWINMLPMAFPEPIMSSESVGKCFQQAAHQSRRALFLNCISLPNGSQMFVFQLLSTLLIVLIYLVNVDPRRTDPGFKSLSIGFGYFVASALTINSGGFFSNPFQLLALSLFSSTESNWQGEWWIYLITPLIGGLFSAISHEYIDFVSLRNRNRSLHLRRSFHSLEELNQPHQSTTIGLDGTGSGALGEQFMANGLVKLSSRGSSLELAPPPSQLSSASSISTYMDSRSPEKDSHQELSSKWGRKLDTSSYSRQLIRHQRLLNQQAATVQRSNELADRVERTRRQNSHRVPVARSRRASDYDSNFLISSNPSSSTVNCDNSLAHCCSDPKEQSIMIRTSVM